jgi:signal transduction histidine kinase
MGRRDIAAPVRGPAEIRKLAITLNEMSAELKKQEEWREHLMEDLAHELRTPLMSILVQIEAILDGIRDPDPARMGMIYHELERLARLLNDLQKLSEAENAQFSLRLKRTNMVQLTRSVYLSFLPIAEEKRVKLSFESVNVPCYALVDRDRMIQVISNLVSNAIKYTPAGGRVVLSVDWTADYTLIACKDNGIGIAEEDQPYVFNRLYRVDKSRSRFSGGVGIGLSIAKALAEAHHGRITLESKLGEGSTFTVIVPNELTKMES